MSTTYLSLIERGHRVPSLESFIEIANALNVTTDSLLRDVLKAEYLVQGAELTKRLDGLSPRERKKVLSMLDVLIENL